MDNYKFILSDNYWSYSYTERLFRMFAVPLLPAVAVTLISAVSAFGVSAFDYKARPVLYSGIVLCFVPLSVTALPDFVSASNIGIIDSSMMAFYAVFCSAAPLVGFVYMKAVIEEALVLGQRPIPAAVLGGIPTLLVTYVLCFMHPFVDMLLYSIPGFTVYFDMGREPFQTTSNILLIGIVFGFLLLAAVTAVLLFPRKRERRKKSPIPTTVEGTSAV